MKLSRLFSLLIVVLIVAHILAPVAAAHPLGNFTINHYTGLQFSRDAIEIDFVLDMAEIPAFQEMATFDANANGQPDLSETAAYHRAKCDALQRDLVFKLAGRRLALNLVSSAVEFPAGAGGLPTLRLSCNFRAVIPALTEAALFEFNNNVYAKRLGWREIVVAGDAFIFPAELASLNYSLSQRLTNYPTDLLTTPLDQRQLSFTLQPLAVAVQQPLQALAAGQPVDQTLLDRNDGFTQLITLQNLTLPAILVALGLAFAWGAAHALTPGHGKTIVAAYLVGSRGTVRHALFLGLTTTVTHTAGVFILGFLTLFASRFVLPEQLYPWLGVASGLLVVWIGLSLFRGRLQGLTGSHHHHDHDHSHPHSHAHDHEPHDHGFGSQPHSHMPPGADNGPVTWRSLLALGVSGGLLPCPSALIVMLSAIALQRISFGLVLIVAFSLGLASVLTLIGLLWVQTRHWFEIIPKRGPLFGHLAGPGRLFRLLPAASAIFITVAGVGITFQALTQTGLLTVL
jgi:ABC-type nickel/cobalt efflux system permease component RcnA